MMVLWLVSISGWGVHHNIVRATTEDEAIALVCRSGFDRARIDVTPLPHEGEPAIVWCYEDSPDSPRDS